MFSAWVVEERNLILRQELPEAEGRMFADLACKAKVGDIEGWDQFKVFSPERLGT